VDLKARELRTCKVCGAKFSATAENEACPVCLLSQAVAGAVESYECFSSSESVESAPARAALRFDHYELALDEFGQPLELGRGAMGVTYKAVDINLRCPVTLKIIHGRYLGDEAARLRFLREARAAASVRHPNVASVFHLGTRGQDYFYAMEFVEGETLQNLIKRCGRLEAKVALGITTQVAAGLNAVHKKGLVHRDIKSSNIMVSSDEGGAIAAKIIDLGLAKVINEEGSQTTISTPGCFAGTPEYASPEQFAGVGVDIRSDLYSLGVVFWEMLMAQTPFRGSPAELMYQHQHAPLPFGQLEGLPEAVVALIEALLDKNPSRRFQTPAEFLELMATVTDAIGEGRTLTYQSFRQMPVGDSYALTPTAPRRRGPEKISISRLPVTGSDIFGRGEDIAFLDDSWANQDVNVVTIVAWAGVGKSTLVNHWLRALAAQQYRSAEVVFGWSFYRQGTGEGTSSAEEFLDVALTWFGDPDPRIGTAWEKGERLANLVAHRRSLLVLDGLEPLQYPPGPQEGRLRDASLQAFLRELAAFNLGLCVITTRLPVADIADHERTSAPRRDLEHLSSDAGARLLRALGVQGDEAELRSASEEFGGHCLALTLLGSYLTDAYHGDIRRRKEVLERLTQDVRQGAHARKVMESYQTWFGEGPELSVLRMLGLFDRPADEKALEALLNPPAIAGLTESLANLSATERRALLARLRRARLLAGEDFHQPGHLDTHPLIREYFGEQLRSQQEDAWKECNRRLFYYYRAIAPHLPDSLREMEPLFRAVICGCHAGLFREALHDVYIPRIQRGDDLFAANTLGTRGPLLTVLIHFFENGRWGSPVKTAVGEQSLTAEDQLFILMQAAQYLTAMRGMGATEPRICYERAEPLCRALNLPRLLYVALIGQWRYSLQTDRLTATMQIAERIYSLAQEQNDPALLLGAYRALAGTHFFLGDFASAQQHAQQGLQIWRSGRIQANAEEYYTPIVSCLLYKAFSEWQLGETTSCRANMDEAISIAVELNDTNALAAALNGAAGLAVDERNPVEVDRFSSALIELSTRHHFVHWLAEGTICRGWARSVSGNTIEGIPCIERGIEDYRATGSLLALPYYLARKAEALHLADRTPEALQAIEEAEAVGQKMEERVDLAELHRLRGVFLASMGAEETRIEASFFEALRIAKEQKSISLEKRAEGSYVEYRRRKASGPGGRGFRLPLW
jgi:serine/threonine protein kinase/tetratricopeptide (TPR) repeat protein